MLTASLTMTTKGTLVTMLTIMTIPMTATAARAHTVCLVLGVAGAWAALRAISAGYHGWPESAVQFSHWGGGVRFPRGLRRKCMKEPTINLTRHDRGFKLVHTYRIYAICCVYGMNKHKKIKLRGAFLPSTESVRDAIRLFDFFAGGN